MNGTVVDRPSFRVRPGTDDVRVDGREVRLSGARYYVFYKPRGVLSTMADPQGRPCVGDYIRRLGEHIFPIGRLDRDSEGLLILTNDGEFAERILHPRHHVARVYRVWIDRTLAPTERQRIRRGLRCDGRVLRAAELESAGRDGKSYIYRVVLREGRNRQIRRLMRQLGVRVLRLQRTAIGEISLGRLKPGEIASLDWRQCAPPRPAIAD